MKLIITALATTLSLAVFGQTAREHFDNGIAKHNQKDYKGAIKDYDKAIKADKEYADAYFNRGSCELGLQDFKPALADFSKAIEIAPNFAKAYYSRATVYVSLEKHSEALPDLDKVIELDRKTPNALTLRGQIRAQTGNLKGACEDFNTAKEIGDSRADKYLTQFCEKEKQSKESLVLDWPEDENWKVGSNQDANGTTMMELIHKNETFDNWTEIGTMMSVKGVKNMSMDKVMNLMFDQAKGNSKKPKLTFIEKDESVEYPWILFTIEAPPESQLYYIVQGKNALYTNFRAIKKGSIPEDVKEKWIKFFKTGKIVNK